MDNLLVAKKKQRLVLSHRQGGATLVVALVILLVMSVIGVSNLQSSSLQERMAGNNRQKTVAKYAAESALKVAEHWLDQNVTGTSKISLFNGSSGLYSAIKIATNISASPSTSDITHIENATDWGATTAYTGSGNIVDSSSVSRQPQYIIEYIGRDYRGSATKVIGTDDLSNGSKNNTSKPFFFRITAIGWGKDNKIYTVLESVYKTGSSEYFNY